MLKQPPIIWCMRINGHEINFKFSWRNQDFYFRLLVYFSSNYSSSYYQILSKLSFHYFHWFLLGWDSVLSDLCPLEDLKLFLHTRNSLATDHHDFFKLSLWFTFILDKISFTYHWWCYLQCCIYNCHKMIGLYFNSLPWGGGEITFTIIFVGN